MIDSGATGNFISTQVAIDNGFRIVKKDRPYPLYVVDGGTIGEGNGWITQETPSLEMTMLRGHSEYIQFDLVPLGGHQVILGMPWLRLHNPRIDWVGEKIYMDQCQCGPRRPPTLSRETASLGQQEISATS
jgi:Retroviral aspartyl protease